MVGSSDESFYSLLCASVLGLGMVLEHRTDQLLTNIQPLQGLLHPRRKECRVKLSL